MVLISCKNCHTVYTKKDYNEFICEVCRHKVRKRVKNSLQISLALTLCALLLYIPAMLYPMMEVTQLGVSVKSTILEGVISFLDMKSYFIAAVIFTASVAIPVMKLLGLFIIFFSLKFKVNFSKKAKSIIYKIIEIIGKWSMIDIFVVAILASVVQMGEVFSIKGGVATISFTSMVVITMLAAHKFDTRIIWDE